MSSVLHEFGPYKVEKPVGHGGMAVVYLAVDSRTGRRVALKLVHLPSHKDSEEILHAERMGAELQRQFSPVNAFVPEVYEHGLDGDYFYVAMEYLDGENLSALISRGPIPIAHAVAIATDLCRFLVDAHAFETTIRDQRLHSLIHGDLTPSNIRITSTGQVKVLDFGIAKALSLTRKVTKNDFGNFAYLSPERLEFNEVDPHADFWALGVLLYEMVQGARPFQAPDTRRLEQRILSRRPPPALDGGCPPGLQAIVAKLLAPDSTDRYPNARAILEDLERSTMAVPTLAEQDGWPRRQGDEPPTRRTRPAATAAEEPTRRTKSDLERSSIAAAPSTAQPPPVRKKRRFRIAVAALAVLILIVYGQEIRVATEADRVTRTVPTRELDGLSDAWREYEALSRRTFFRTGLIPLRDSLTEQTATLTDRIIANYRTMPTPTVREAQWKMARDVLARAVAANARNREMKAAMRYADGHLHRINGDARLTRRQIAAAQHEFTEAVTAFREAAELREDWPDPFLGLARVFIYGLEDVDRGADALNQAKRLGYAWSDREIVQLADGYRMRADGLWRKAKQMTGLGQERDYLTRALEAYREALMRYQTVLAFADTPLSIRKVQREIGRIERTLAALSPGAALSSSDASEPTLQLPTNP